MGSNANDYPYLRMIPKWGLRRTIGNHFIFEFAAGIGAAVSKFEKMHVTLDEDLKFGYTF